MTTRRPHVALFCYTLAAGDGGGICRWARMAVRVLARAAAEGRIRATVWSLQGTSGVTDLGLPVRGCRGRRSVFVAAASWAARSCSHFIYDTLGLARSHALLPIFRRPNLVFVHGVEAWELARTDHLRSAHRATALLCNTAYTRARADALHGGFARARVCLLGTDADNAPPPPRTPRPQRVLMVSRVNEDYKGHDVLLDSWPRVVAEVPTARLTFVGRGPKLGELRHRAASSPAADSIEVRGFVPDEELDEVFASSAVFAMPSRGEGFGLVYAEAMRHGLPVVASIHDAGREVNLDGVTGYNIDPDRPDELPDRLTRLLQDQALAAALGSAGRDRWASEFRGSRFFRRLDRHLTDFWTDRWTRSSASDPGDSTRPGDEVTDPINSRTDICSEA